MFTWSAHDENCNTCTHFHTMQKGGRPKRSRKGRGRPAENGIHDLICHIKELAPISLYNDSMAYNILKIHIPAFLNILSQDLECCVCLGILNSPVRLSCGFLFCSNCLVKSIELQGGNCPICHSLVKSDIQQLDSVHLRLLESISVQCNTCSKYIVLRNMNEHVQNTCSAPPFVPVLSPARIVPQEQPSLSAATVKKMMHNGCLTVATGGQVSKVK